MMTPQALVLAYVEAASQKDLARLEALIAPDVEFTGPARSFTGLAELQAALRRLSAIHVRNDVKRVFSDGDEACVIYDLVTVNGPIKTIEWVRAVDGKIARIDLYYDQLPFKTVREEMERRAKATA